MGIEIKVPTLGESVTEATVSRWLKAVGDHIGKDENLAELETDKVTLDVSSPVSGKVISLAVAEGETVLANAILAEIEEGAGQAPSAPTPAATPSASDAPAPVASPAPVATPPSVVASSCAAFK